MAQEEGFLSEPDPESNIRSQIVIGSYSYTAPDGQNVSVSYTADKNGFQPVGSHIPASSSFTAEYHK